MDKKYIYKVIVGIYSFHILHTLHVTYARRVYIPTLH